MRQEHLWAISRVHRDAHGVHCAILDEYDLYKTQKAAQEECDKYNRRATQSLYYKWTEQLHDNLLLWVCANLTRNSDSKFQVPNFELDENTQCSFYYPEPMTLTIYD